MVSHQPLAEEKGTQPLKISLSSPAHSAMNTRGPRTSNSPHRVCICKSLVLVLFLVTLVDQAFSALIFKYILYSETLHVLVLAGDKKN